MKITLLTGRTFNFAKELGFAIKTVKSSSARRLTLRIDEKERIPVLSIPKFCSNHKALDFVEDAVNGLNLGVTLDVVSIDLKNLWMALGEITGNNNNEEIINEIFSGFCVGK